MANMIGTGVFTSLGFQLPDIRNTAALLLLWVLGGLFALAGAFSYAEIGTAINRSGGEYTFLSKIYHPIIGYLSGWISITVGFAAPVALAAIAVSKYASQAGFRSAYLGALIVIAISVVHSFNLRVSAAFQNLSTVFKVVFILAFIAAGISIGAAPENAISYVTSAKAEFLSAAFAISLIYVTYAYSGWNAAAYITEEFRSSRTDLPRALIGGTVVVTVLYTLLQYVFLRHAPYEALVNQVEVGAIAASNMFPASVSALFSGIISLLLVSSISAMVWVGPRVTSKMSEDYRLWSFLRFNGNNIPVKAIWFQAAISIALLLTGTFEQILVYCGMLLNISSALVVLGVFVVRRRQQFSTVYRSPGFPLWQLFFLLMSLWMIVFAVLYKPLETLIGLSNLGVGVITYFINKRISTA